MRRIGDLFGNRSAKWASKSLLFAFVVSAAVVALGLANGTSNSVEAQEQKSAAAAPAYEFDVATIKSAPPGSNGGAGGFISDDTYRARNFNFRQIIRTAYGKWGGGDGLVAGGPSWLDSEMYDVTAKLDPSVVEALSKLRPDDRKLEQERILQKLLADRLKLQVHTETKERQVYLLTIAKNGPKLQEAKPGDPDPMKAFPYADKFAGGAKAGEIYGVIDGAQGAMARTLYGVGASTFALARQLTVYTGQVVLDKTGLTGLKLVSGKGPVEVIVIDHVERPTGN